MCETPDDNAQQAIELASTVLQEDEQRSRKGSYLPDQSETFGIKQTITNHSLENVTQYLQDKVIQIELENVTLIELENISQIRPEITSITEIDQINDTRFAQQNITQINYAIQSSVYLGNFTQLKQDNATSISNDSTTPLDLGKVTLPHLKNYSLFDNLTQIDLESVTQIELENVARIHPEITNIPEIDKESYTQFKQKSVSEISNDNTTPVDLRNVPLPQLENNTLFDMENVIQDDPISSKSTAIDLFSIFTKPLTKTTTDNSTINKTDRKYNSLQNGNLFQIAVVVVLLLQPVLFALIVVLWCKYRRQGILQDVSGRRHDLTSLNGHLRELDYSSIHEQRARSMYQRNAVFNVTDSVAVNEYEDLTCDNDKVDYTQLNTTDSFLKQTSQDVYH